VHAGREPDGRERALGEHDGQISQLTVVDHVGDIDRELVHREVDRLTDESRTEHQTEDERVDIPVGVDPEP